MRSGAISRASGGYALGRVFERVAAVILSLSGGFPANGHDRSNSETNEIEDVALVRNETVSHGNKTLAKNPPRTGPNENRYATTAALDPSAGG
jgi:hypothetical protein